MAHLIHIDQNPRAAETPLHLTSNDADSKSKHAESCERKQLSSDSLMRLENEYNELSRTWKAFHNRLYPDDHKDLEQGAQTVEDVLRVVREAEEMWMSSTHRRHLGWSLMLLNSFTTTLSSHSTLLCAFPKAEKYRSLLYGVLQSIIKASTKYYKIAESLSQALIEINEAVFCAQGAESDPSFGVLYSIASLYSQIFLFLGEFMYWYTKKATCRLLGSHRQDFYSDLRFLIHVIRETCRAISTGFKDSSRPTMTIEMKGGTTLSQATLYLMEQARLSQAGLRGTDRHVASQNTIIRQLMWQIQQDASERRRMMKEKEMLLSQLVQLLEQKVHGFEKRGKNDMAVTNAALDDIGMDIVPLICLAGSGLSGKNQVIPHTESPKGSKRKVSKVELELSSKDLQDFFDNDDQLLTLELPLEIYADPGVIVSLREWTLSLRSQVLAIACPSVTSSLCPATILSAYYTWSAQRAGLPVISHFCSLPQRTSDESTSAARGLVALIYSLIRQLIELAPPVLDCELSCDLSADRFRKLDGTLNTWKEAISILDALLNFVPPVLFCVIGGSDVLDDPSTKGCLQSLVRTLVARTNAPGSASNNGTNGRKPALLKVLLAMSGKSTMLSDIATDQVIITDSLRIGRAAEHPVFLEPDTMMGNC